MQTRSRATTTLFLLGTLCVALGPMPGAQAQCTIPENIVSAQTIDDSGRQAIRACVVFTQQARKDARTLASSGLKDKAQTLLAVLAQNPFQNPPPYEKLVGDLAGAYSRRINIQHRLVYEVLSSERVVKVLRMWTHYE